MAHRKLPHGVRADGSTEGPATCWYDPEKKCLGHFDANHEFIPHQAPEGWRYGPDGVLIATAEKKEKQDG